MNGAHDLGGMHGFGSIDAEPQATEPVFHAPWEGTVFSVSRSLLQRRLWSLDEFRSTIEHQPPADYLSHSYYENWLGALERLVVGHELATAAELASGRSAGHTGPRAAAWQPYNAEPVPAPRFTAGDVVRVRNRHPIGHTRAPRYVRGRVGTVVGDDGAEPLPEHAAENVCSPEHVYSVRFESAELWGTETGHGHAVFVNLWESYLEQAS